jgi:hypothetical protein
VFTVFAVRGEHEPATCCFEIEIFAGTGRVLNKHFDAGIFPATSVVFGYFGSEAVYRFLDGELH